MKKIFNVSKILIALMLLIIVLCSCNSNTETVSSEVSSEEGCDHKIAYIKGKDPTCSEAGLTAGSYCTLCDVVLSEQKEIEKTEHNIKMLYDAESHVIKCTRCDYSFKDNHKLDENNKCSDCDYEIIETPLFKKGYITTEYTEIETEHFICKLPVNTYVIDDLEEYLEIIYDAVQITSGLNYNIEKCGKITIKVEDIEPHEDGYVPEVLSAYALYNTVVICKGELFTTGGSTLIHELTHILQNHNSNWSFCKTMTEGFATYNQYKTVKYIEKNYPDLAFYLDSGEKVIFDMFIEEDGYDYLFAEPLSYWYINGFPHAGNADYTVGFRFMRYLDEVYGDYSSWITNYHKLNPTASHLFDTSMMMEDDEILKVMPSAYGDDVEENFYSWLKENLSFFDVYYDQVITDRTKVEFANIYPSYWYWLDSAVFTGFEYKDVYFNIDELRYYITEYKGDEIGDFRFESVTLEPVTVKFYDSEGNLLRIENSNKTKNSFSLDGVGFVQFVGEGTIAQFDIFGFGSIE